MKLLRWGRAEILIGRKRLAVQRPQGSFLKGPGLVAYTDSPLTLSHLPISASRCASCKASSLLRSASSA